jgi:hypothetical protein
VNVEALRARGEALSQELGLESYRAGAGLVAETRFEAIFEAYRDLASDEAWEAARGRRELEEWVADARIGRAVAALDDRLHAWESSAEIEPEGGERMPYQRAGIAIANDPVRERRLAIDRARRGAAAEPAAIRAERLGWEKDLLDALLGVGVVDARVRLSGIDLAALAEDCRAFLADTAALYRDALQYRLARELGLAPGEADRTDGAFLFRAAAYDEFFPGGSLVATAIAQTAEMGLDAHAAGRIRHDTGERERKRARAFCAPVRVPDEVYLVIRPHGGYVDYRAFWHELGHALHFANAARELSFEHRWLGDNSVTEAYAMLFEHQTMAPAWLRRYARMSEAKLADFLRTQAFALLAIVRRYAAKLNYEIELHRAPSLAAGARHYAELLTEATGFRYAAEDALLDLDDGFYAARYLRAWQLEAALRTSLVERFDEDWFRNPRSGPAVLELLARGQRDDAVRVADAALGTTLAFAPLAAWCEAALG